ncbi:hypothetical protein B0H13DRAFT_2319834 [Mycena leptocephala]|nr:hypothetical protein B0H13DRAFT_2319834 [Mycena leptocephala]
MPHRAVRHPVVPNIQTQAAWRGDRFFLASEDAANGVVGDAVGNLQRKWQKFQGDKVPQFFEPFIHHDILAVGSDTEWQREDGPLPSDDDSSDSDRDLVGQDLSSFALAGNNDEYEAIIEHKSEKDWIAAEKKLNGPYTGNSARTQRRQDKKLRDKEKLNVISRDSVSATAFKKMFAVLPRTFESNTAIVPAPGTAVSAIIPVHTSLPAPSIASPGPAPQTNIAAFAAPAGEIFPGYISDISYGESYETQKEDPGRAPGEGDTDERIPVQGAEVVMSPPIPGSAEEPRRHQVQPIPPLRRTKFAVPQAERRRLFTAQAAAARANIFASALTAIDKLIASKKNVFHAGNASLQS